MTDEATREGAHGSHPPEEVFSILGDETRLRILLELADRSEPEQVAPVRSFSELRRAVGVEDAGRFSYHLDRLRDRFVVKEEDGYRATVAGLEVASSVHAGRFTADATVEPEPIGGRCPLCGEPLEARYEDGLAELGCEGDETVFTYPVPPGAAVGRSAGELLAVAQRRATVDVELARTGVCPRCWGVAGAVVQPEEGQYEDVGVGGPAVDVECERCWVAYSVPAALAVARSPPVVAFYHDHGLDADDVLSSEHNVVAIAEATIDGRNPLRVAVDVELEGDRLALELDQRCQVLSSDRR